MWLDNEDVCRILNISKRQLQHYRDCRRIPLSIIGKKCYYKVTDVEKLISESQIRQIRLWKYKICAQKKPLSLLRHLKNS
ncbi:helix-turn-helix domain-containing protein, partial [Alistipes sp. OttesenSCG-928-B03]|nr:helix-turn-helix domain-containing protein [Alistipes sp. OttesenSCG-928-B03]